MQESGVISGYVELLVGALEFDRSLSRQVRQEVEDHLWETVAADPTDDVIDAERRAVANFGDPHVIAAQFAVVSLAKHSRRVGIASILVIAGVFVAMKARLAWYEVAQCAVSDEFRAITGPVVAIDRYAFWLSIIIGFAGWAYIGSRPIPSSFHPAYREQLRRFVLLCTLATAALVVSVISDGVLTALRLAGTDLSAEFLIPVVSMAIEIAGAGALVLHIHRITQRTAFTAALMRT
jgi:hypothetical protein